LQKEFEAFNTDFVYDEKKVKYNNKRKWAKEISD
jgi:hypothetical protein